MNRGIHVTQVSLDSFAVTVILEKEEMTDVELLMRAANELQREALRKAHGLK